MQFLSLQDFARHQGSTFDLSLGSNTLGLTLSEAAPLTNWASPGGRRDPFRLILRSTSFIVLPQQIYDLRHPALGTLGIFIVPIMKGREGIIYEAIFN